MKNLSWKKASLMVAGMAALLWATPANAQVKTMRLDIPFQFVAGDQVMPSGIYEFRLDQFARIVIWPTAENKVYLVRLTSEYLTRPGNDQERGKIQFAKYGDTLFLNAAWGPGSSDARVLAPSKRLLEAKNVMGKGGSVERVTLDSNLK